MAQQHTFPQSGDEDDAENFAQMIGQPNLVDFVITGMSLSPSFGVPEVTIGTGVCAISQTSDTASSTGETRLQTGTIVQLPQSTESLIDNDVNYIYVTPDIGTDDNGSYTVYTNENNAGSDELKIGEIDTSSDATTLYNRSPNGSFSTPFTLVDAAGDTTLAEITGSGPFDHYTDIDLHNNHLDDVNSIDGGGDTIDLNDDLNFASLSGSPTFSSHDHTESGLTQIPNAGLTNSSITVSAGDGLSGGGSASLGSSTSLDVRLDIEDGGSNVTTAYGINFGDQLSVTNDGDNTITVDSTALTEIVVEEDGSTVVSNANKLDFAGSDFNVSNPTASEAEIRVHTDAIGTDEIDLSITPTWTGIHVFQQSPGSGSTDILQLRDGNTNDRLDFHINSSNEFVMQVFDSSAGVDRGVLRWDPALEQTDVISTLNFPDVPGSPTFSSHDHSEGGMTTIPNGGLTNSSLTINGGDGLKNGGSVSLGSSLTLDIEPADFAGPGLKDDGTDDLAIEPTDFAGDGVEDDGADNLRVVPGRYTRARNGGQNVWVQSSQPTANATGDLWIDTS